jgi:ankyrin repeat protein
LWLRRAAAQNKIKFVRFLLNNGVDAKDQRQFLTFFACAYLNIHPVYSRQADISQPQDKVDSLPFLTEKVFDAKNKGMQLSPEYLCLMQADGTRDVSMKTALHYAAENGHKDIVCLLVEKGADVCDQGMFFFAALTYASLFLTPHFRGWELDSHSCCRLQRTLRSCQDLVREGRGCQCSRYVFFPPSHIQKPTV